MPRQLPEVDRSYTGPRPAVSVIVLTLNEEINIEACLASCAWCDEVCVLDSGSTDATVQIARRLGARVFTHPFAGFGQQRNWAIENIQTKHRWVFFLDADERFTPSLLAEMGEVLRPEPAHAGYLVANQMIFMGSWIKRSSGYPAYQLRLFHKDRLRFADSGHGQRHETAGTVGTLKQPYVHHNFSKGLAEWLDRHNRYSTKEAAEIVARRREPLRLGGLLGDTVTRRQTLKRVFARLPFRSTIRFFWAMVFDRGLLDGVPGLNYARLLAVYEQMISLKVREGLSRDGAR